MFFWKIAVLLLLLSHLFWIVWLLHVWSGDLPGNATSILEDAATCQADGAELDRSDDNMAASFSAIFDQGMWVGTPRGRFAYMVVVRGEGREHICSGVLIHELFVLTAAHCIDKLGPNPILTISAYNVNDGWCQKGVKEVRGKRAHKHPKWNGMFANGYDVAIVELRHPIFHPQGYPTLAAPSFEIYPNYRVFAFKWGPALQAAMFDVVRNTLCPKMEGLKNSSICIYSAWANMDAGCSGGPVMMLDVEQDGIHYGRQRMDLILGIVSSSNYSALEDSGTQIIPMTDPEIYNWVDTFF